MQYWRRPSRQKEHTVTACIIKSIERRNSDSLFLGFMTSTDFCHGIVGIKKVVTYKSQWNSHIRKLQASLIMFENIVNLHWSWRYFWLAYIDISILKQYPSYQCKSKWRIKQSFIPAKLSRSNVEYFCIWSTLGLQWKFEILSNRNTRLTEVKMLVQNQGIWKSTGTADQLVKIAEGPLKTLQQNKRPMSMIVSILQITI